MLCCKRIQRRNWLQRLEYILILNPLEEYFQEQIKDINMYIILLNLIIILLMNGILRKEIKDVKWFNYQDSQNHIRDINIERKDYLKD
jgi:hypothetical protein